MNEDTKKSVNKKLIILILLIAVSAVLWAGNRLGIWGNPFGGMETVMGSAPADTVNGLKITFIDVGQGDSAYIECGGKTLLIDSGEKGNGQKINNIIRSGGTKKLDYVIATHPHTDHIGSLADVLEEFGAETVIMPHLPNALVPTSSTFSNFLDAVSRRADKAVYAAAGDKYSLGDAGFEIIAPVSQEHDNLNDMSIVIKLTYGENTFLLTGDAAESEEADIIASGADIDCDVLKVAHHGSDTSSAEAFLAKIVPEICVISCGKDNDYGHPHAALLQRLSVYTKRVYRTDLSGNIVLLSDGKNIKTIINGNEVF